MWGWGALKRTTRVFSSGVELGGPDTKDTTTWERFQFGVPWGVTSETEDLPEVVVVHLSGQDL